MTVAKLKIIQSNIVDAYDKIDDSTINSSYLERKLTLLNLITAINLFLKESCSKVEYSLIELNGLEKQLELISKLKNISQLPPDYENMESQILKRKEDILLAINDWEVTTTVNLPEELLTQITSWYE